MKYFVPDWYSGKGGKKCEISVRKCCPIFLPKHWIFRFSAASMRAGRISQILLRWLSKGCVRFFSILSWFWDSGRKRSPFLEEAILRAEKKKIPAVVYSLDVWLWHATSVHVTLDRTWPCRMPLRQEGALLLWEGDCREWDNERGQEIFWINDAIFALAKVLLSCTNCWAHF